MKVAIIHHNGDMDGLMSGTLAKLTWETIQNFNSEVVYNIFGYNYGKNPDEDVWLDYLSNEYDYYQFIDVTPPITWLTAMSVRKSTIHIFDHHKPVFEQIQTLPIARNNNESFIYYFNENYCGVYIYWLELLSKINFIDDSLLTNKENILNNLRKFIDTTFYYELIKLVDQYDTWKWQNNENAINWNALYVNEFFLNYKTIDEFYQICFGNIKLSNIIDKGETISEIKSQIAKNTKHFLATINNYQMCIINDKASIYHINNVKSLYPDVVGIIFYKDLNLLFSTINLSVRQIDKTFDCNEFVKSISTNGGGHQGAAGCQIMIGNFLNLINKNK